MQLSVMPHPSRQPWHPPAAPTVSNFRVWRFIFGDVLRIDGHIFLTTNIPTVTVTNEFDATDLLQAILAEIGDGAFLSKRLRQDAVVGGPLHLAIGGRSNGQLGKLLRKIADSRKSFSGLRLMRGGKEGNAVFWQVVVDY